MSTPPWKKTNSRVNTNNNDIIHCDELFTDELVSKNAVLNKKVKISKEVTTNNFDVSNISINDTMEVPDICINRIGRHISTSKKPEEFSNNEMLVFELSHIIIIFGILPSSLISLIKSKNLLILLRIDVISIYICF